MGGGFSRLFSNAESMAKVVESLQEEARAKEVEKAKRVLEENKPWWFKEGAKARVWGSDVAGKCLSIFLFTFTDL